MRLLPVVAVAAASLGLVACTVNTGPSPAPMAAPAAVVTPAPTVVTPAPMMAPSGTVIVR